MLSDVSCLIMWTYTAKHEHWDILDLIAPVMIDRPLAELALKLPLKMFAAWVRTLIQSPCSLFYMVVGLIPREMGHRPSGHSARSPSSPPV